MLFFVVWALSICRVDRRCSFYFTEMNTPISNRADRTSWGGAILVLVPSCRIAGHSYYSIIKSRVLGFLCYVNKETGREFLFEKDAKSKKKVRNMNIMDEVDRGRMLYLYRACRPPLIDGSSLIRHLARSPLPVLGSKESAT